MKERPNNPCRVYAILDEQSNLSLIRSELADELGVVGPWEKYFLTTCGGEKEVKYGRRVTGAIVESLNVAPYSFTIARALGTKVQVICALWKGNVSVCDILVRPHEHKKKTDSEFSRVSFGEIL